MTNSELHAEAAIWAEGTPFTADNLAAAYRAYEAAADGDPDLGFGEWCQCEMGIVNETPKVDS